MNRESLIGYLWRMAESFVVKAMMDHGSASVRFMVESDRVGFEMNPHSGSESKGPDEKTLKLIDAARALVIGIEDKSDGPLDGLIGEVKKSLSTLYDDVPEWAVSVPVQKVQHQQGIDTPPSIRESAHYYRVFNFMRFAGQPTPDKPVIPDLETRKLRAKLQLEEAFEKCAGLAVNPILITPEGLRLNLLDYDLDFVQDDEHEPDIVKIIDAVMDNRVIATGTLIACGVREGDFQKLVDESNLAKFEIVCPNCDWKHYGRLDQKSPELALNGGNRCPSCRTEFIGPHRREDGKWVKGEGWKAPDIEGELKKQME